MRVKLFRDSFDTPWGFRLQGGRDLNQSLVVQRVFSNTPAEGELQRGDIFLEINGRDAAGYTHKQALDQIKFGGGQIELLIERPATPNINPLHPTSPTRAPSNLPPVLPGAIQIPIKKRPDAVYAAPSMPPPQNTSGHQPKKITLTKYGGGTSSYGTNYGKPSQPSGWSHQPAPSSQQQYSPQSNMMVRVQDSLDSALSPTRAYSSYQQSPPYQAPPQLRQFSAGPASFSSPGMNSSQLELQDSQPSYIRSCDPVPEDDYAYIPVSQRKKTFASQPPPPQYDIRYSNGNYEFQEVAEEDEDDYPTAPVWERRKMFGQPISKKQAEPGGRKGPRPFQPQSQSYVDFGVDYTKLQKQPELPKFQPSTAAPPPPAPAQHRPAPHSGDTVQQYGKSPAWSSSLRASDIPKPWELEQQDNYMPAQNTPQRGPPNVSPKPTSPRPQSQGRQLSVSMSSTATPATTTKNGNRDWSESHVYRMLHDQHGPPPSHAAPAVNTQPPQPPMLKPAPPAPPAPRQAPPQQQQYQQPQQNSYNNIDESYGTSDF